MIPLLRLTVLCSEIEMIADPPDMMTGGMNGRDAIRIVLHANRTILETPHRILMTMVIAVDIRIVTERGDARDPGHHAIAASGVRPAATHHVKIALGIGARLPVTRTIEIARCAVL